LIDLGKTAPVQFSFGLAAQPQLQDCISDVWANGDHHLPGQWSQRNQVKQAFGGQVLEKIVEASLLSVDYFWTHVSSQERRQRGGQSLTQIFMDHFNRPSALGEAIWRPEVIRLNLTLIAFVAAGLWSSGGCGAASPHRPDHQVGQIDPLFAIGLLDFDGAG
jgi:hypothetical protein